MGILHIFTAEEKEEVKVQVSMYKELREFIQFGEMYRLLSPFEGNETAWMFVAEDKTQAFVSYFRILATPNAPLKKLTLNGLDPNADYKIADEEGIYGGDELMYSGINVPDLNGDYRSMIWKTTMQ